MELSPEECTALAETIAYELQGTCDSLTASLERHDQDGLDEYSSDFCNRLDQLVFECERCSWWFEISEMTTKSDRWICEECDGTEEEEE